MHVLYDTSCSKPQSTESAHLAVDLCMSSVIPLVQSPSPQRVFTLLFTYMHVLCVTSCSKPQSTESAHLAVDLCMSSVIPLVQSPVHRECSPCC
ncbi:hypothetical protein DPMN_040865 [Dreissena polymorpha]|uniref:Uncharacterized protein n=1 Tax=Dreissena polymorpha TaxID=45954 RepID=A0A9D4HTG3_DREPO|nr:hypothetical protein DPMN_040865 [Dreissena polymorpha]